MSSHRSIPTVDRISALPDSVIYHILSFLPTKQSAATSILSKRWKPLWLSVLTLDFDYRDFADFTSFRLFVYYVMLTRDPASPIQSFRFKCGNSSGFNGHDVNLFIHSVVKRGIQNLNLDMSPSPVYFKLPQCVSSCSNLTVLKLKTLSISCLLDANFPLLKTLHLDRISFNGRRTTYFLKNLLNGCPALEYLRTYGLVQSGFKDEEFNCLLKLVEASISNSTILNIPFAWVCNAKFLFTRLKIPYCYQVPTFLNLTRMKIVFQLTNDWLGKWKWLIEVLQNCPKLQNLIIHEDSTYENEVGDGDCDWMDPPIVSKCLLSELRTCSLIGYEGMKSEFQFAEYILKNAKVLHTMIITASPVDINIKHQMLMKLSLCLRGSATCKLSFD